jgi:predicted MFS family arabinose efflux permease
MSTRPLRPSPDRPPPRAWALLAFLTLLNVLNFVDRQLIASLAPLLIADLGLSRAQIGLLVGFAFVVFYTVMGMVLGAAADRMSRPRLIAAGLGLWSLMTAVSGLARSFLHLAIPRMLVGVGEATLTPAALSMLGDVFPARRLAFASGVYYAGIPLGTALSLLVAGWMAPRYGWRACFYALGAIGLVLAVVLLPMRDPRQLRHAGDAASGVAVRPGVGEIVRALLRTIRDVPAFGLSIAGGTLLVFASAAALHVITWLVEERGLPFAQAAFTAGAIAAVAGFTGNMAGGWFADSCQRRWRAGRLWSLVLLTVGFTPFSAAFFLLPPDSATFYLCWFVASASTTTYFGPLLAIVQATAPVQIRSTAVAFTLLVMNLLGVGPGPWITGMIGDASSLTAGLLLSLVVGLSAVVPFALAARTYEADVARAALAMDASRARR